MISYDYAIVSSTQPLQVKDTLFSVMVLLVTYVNYITTWQFLVNGHAAFFDNYILVFGLVVSMDVTFLIRSLIIFDKLLKQW